LDLQTGQWGAPTVIYSQVPCSLALVRSLRTRDKPSPMTFGLGWAVPPGAWVFTQRRTSVCAKRETRLQLSTTHLPPPSPAATLRALGTTPRLLNNRRFGLAFGLSSSPIHNPMRQAEDGGIPKVTANKIVELSSGVWLLPFWREKALVAASPECATEVSLALGSIRGQGRWSGWVRTKLDASESSQWFVRVDLESVGCVVGDAGEGQAECGSAAVHGQRKELERGGRAHCRPYVAH